MLQSTKIAIGFAAGAALLFGGYRYAMRNAIMGEQFSQVVPGKVNLVGIDPGSGYRILVANQMAQLVQASGDFEGNDSGEGGATEGAIKKRIPVREMLEVLQGDSEALGEFAMTLNEMSEEQLPPDMSECTWTAEDLRKALDGDKALAAELERDLNMKLDGTPLPRLRPTSLENGIVVKAPVTVKVNVEGKVREVTGYVLDPYKPRLLRAVEDRYKDKPNLDVNMQSGYYAEEARRALETGDRENIRKALEYKISKGLAEERAKAPERVLKSATVVVSDAQIEGASYRGYDTSDGRRFDLTVRMSDEGRRRLWRYSIDKIGSQILLVTDGVAIAAPKIQHELKQGELTINQMRDEVLVRDATQALNKNAGKTAQR